jgi:hypothetical protein
MPEDFSRSAWGAELLRRMDLPVTRDNLTALVAWQRAEGGHVHNNARFNPLNTTYDRPGDQIVNSHGVRAYRSRESGLHATELTLRNGRYGPVLRALRNGGSAERVARAVVASRWGTTALILGCVAGAREEVANEWRKIRGDRRDGDRADRADRGTRHRPVGRGGRRVTIDPAELDDLADAVDRLADVARAVHCRLGQVQSELRLTSAHAPDESTARHLDALLTEARGRLVPFSAALGEDERFVRRTRHKALLADSGGAVMPPDQAQRLLDSLAGTVSPATLAVLEALLLGGLRTDRRAGHRLPTSPRQSPAPHRPSHRGSREEQARDVVRVATSQLGYHEGTGNQTKYGAWYGLNGQPWCAMFVSWVFAKAGHRLPPLQSDKGYAGVRTAAEALRRRGLLRDRPMVGDLYLHRGPTWQQDHTGIVVKVAKDGDFWTIEGNKGDAVQRRFHRANEPSMFGFGRVL